MSWHVSGSMAETAAESGSGPQCACRTLEQPFHALHLFMYTYIICSPWLYPGEPCPSRRSERPTTQLIKGTIIAYRHAQRYLALKYTSPIRRVADAHTSKVRAARTPQAYGGGAHYGQRHKRAYAPHCVVLPQRVTPSSSIGCRIEDRPSPVKAWVFLSRPQRRFRLRSATPRSPRRKGDVTLDGCCGSKII